MVSPLSNGRIQRHFVHWIGPLIIVYLGSGTCMAASRKRRTICGHKQGTTICSLHGQCTITYLQSESCFAGLRCLKLLLSCKAISVTEYFQIDAFDSDPRHLHLRPIELHLPNCGSVPRRTNEPILLPLNSRMNGKKQSPLISGTIGTFNCKVWQVLTHSPLSLSPPLSSLPGLPLSQSVHTCLTLCLFGIIAIVVWPTPWKSDASD